MELNEKGHIHEEKLILTILTTMKHTMYITYPLKRYDTRTQHYLKNIYVVQLGSQQS